MCVCVFGGSRQHENGRAQHVITTSTRAIPPLQAFARLSAVYGGTYMLNKSDAEVCVCACVCVCVCVCAVIIVRLHACVCCVRL